MSEPVKDGGPKSPSDLSFELFRGRIAADKKLSEKLQKAAEKDSKAASPDLLAAIEAAIEEEAA